MLVWPYPGVSVLFPQIGYSSAELAVEWLMSHPEEPAASDASAADTASKDDDEAVKKQLMASLGTDDVPQLEVRT